MKGLDYMSSRTQVLLLRVIAWSVLALVMANIVLAQTNRGLALKNVAKQQFIQGTVTLEGINKEIVNALVELSVKKQDDQLRSLLATNGITFNVNPPADPVQGGKK